MDLCPFFLDATVDGSTSQDLEAVCSPVVPPSVPTDSCLPVDVIDASDSSPGAITDIFKAFTHPYSPSDSQYVYEGDWLDFMDFPLFPEGPLPAVVASNSVLVDATLGAATYDPDVALANPGDAAVDFFSDEWQSFFQSDAYLSWYSHELARGVCSAFPFLLSLPHYF